MEYTWSKYTTLIAEDDPLNFRYLELLLQRRTGINIIWAKDGREARNNCENNTNIDIVLLDLQLPVIDGLKTLEYIKASNPKMPVLIQTANTWNNEEEVCFEKGADGFFTKPLNMDELLKCMDVCMKTHLQFKQRHFKRVG